MEANARLKKNDWSEGKANSVAALEASLAASLAKATALEATSPRALWEADLRLVEPLI